MTAERGLGTAVSTELLYRKLTEEEADRLMLEYKQSGSQELRNQLVMHYSYIAKGIASNMNSTFYRYATTEEMIHQGVIALIDSLERFQPEKGIKFSTYAYTKVRGSIIDYVRKQDWLPRRVRQADIQITRTEEQLTNQLGRKPTREEMAKTLGTTLKEYDQSVFELSGETPCSLESLLESPIQIHSSSLQEEDFNPQEQIDKKELHEVLVQAIDALNDQERTVLSLYYYEDLTMKEIGEVMGVSEQRIGQINRKLIKKLQETLSGYMKG